MENLFSNYLFFTLFGMFVYQNQLMQALNKELLKHNNELIMQMKQLVTHNLKQDWKSVKNINGKGVIVL